MHRRPLLIVAALLVAPCAAWPQGHPLGPEFRVNTYTTGHQGGTITLVLGRPSIASDSTGNFVVVWTSSSQDGSSDGIFGQRYAASGAPLGPEFRVNTYTPLSQFNPDVAADASGNFVVVWESDYQDGSNRGVFGQRYASSGVPLGADFRVNTFTTGEQGDPSVAVDSAGAFVVAWDSANQDGSGAGVFAQRFASSGSPLGPEFRVNTTTFAMQVSPSITSDGSGNFIVVWQGPTIGGLNPKAFGQRYAASGAPLGVEFRVNTTAPGYQFVPDVASDAAGNFVVVWYTDDAFTGGPQDAFGQRFASTGAPLGTEFRVNTTTTPVPWVPSVAMDSAGDFVVMWESPHDGSLIGVFGQRFASTGAPLGTEFLVNTYTTADQSGPAVASDSAGRFVVVWRSDGQDGSGGGVYAQRYSMIVPVELTRFTVE